MFLGSILDIDLEVKVDVSVCIVLVIEFFWLLIEYFKCMFF